ncbi:DUF2505 domain-containing protein [Rhodococcus sp. MEB041]|uniref:DUF2505 domain-containing protein n=1 Tax=Rhodococcus sp. MEB041 TaxID=3040323 RepID=UPI00254A88D7|nr:DUF2505 domain-containing protein [Rhodococcus sp. MEB041]
MQLDLEQKFSADPDTVFALFCDRMFVENRLAIVEATSKELREHEVSDGSLTITVFTTVARSKLPKAVRGFVRGEPEVIRTERWNRVDNGYSGETAVELKGPGDIEGRMALEPDKTGSKVTVHFDIRVPIPMFGADVEKTLSGEIAQIVDTEFGFLSDHLAKG